MGYYPIVSSYTRSIAMCIKYSKDVKKLIPEGRWTPKQMDEAAHVREFLSKIATPPEAALFVVEPDPPDFVVKGDAGQWAIEHTRIFVQSSSGMRPMRGEEKERDHLVKLASQEYESASGAPVLVTFHWPSNQPLHRNDLPRDAKRIARIVRAVVPADGTGISAIIRPLQISNLDWPDGVGEILVYRFEGQNTSRWEAQDGGWHAPLSPRDVQARITTKSTRRSSYATEWPEAWLVIVIEYDKPSSFLILDDVLCKHEYESGFDRIYIWRHADRQYYRLNARRPTC
jgi:hypothetical protein